MKQVKKFCVSPVEQELSFRVWCQKNDIKAVLFDGDDTLWRTVPIFRMQMGKSYDRLVEIGHFDRETWKSKVEEINNRLFETCGVNPIRWDLVVEELGQFGLDDQAKSQLKQVLAEIYQIPPKFVEETESGLAFLKSTGIQMGIVTHANVEWTRRKFGWLGLERFLGWDDVFVVDENGQKTKQSWMEAMNYFKVRPENCVVVGDSPRSDINPVCELGVRHCFLVKNKYDIWSIHQQPVDELKTQEVRSVNDLRWLGREVVYK